MKVCRSFIVAAAAAALSGSCVLAQSQSNSSEQGSQQTSAQSQNQQQAPEGYVLVKESVITLTVNEPQNHFLRAQELMSQGDTRAAAAETRIAAAYLDMQASRDPRGDQGKELQSAANNLRHLATELRNATGQQGSANQGQNQHSSQQQTGQRQWSQQERKLDKQLTQAFAEADHALAAHFQARAQQELGQKKHLQAGYDLDAAASSLKAACIWSGQQPQQSVVKAIADARRASDQLLTVSGEREIGGQQQNATNPQSAEDQAEPASARLNGSDQDQSNQAGSAQGQQQEMQSAHQAVQELGKAIQSTESQIKSGNTDQSGNASGQSSGNAPNQNANQGAQQSGNNSSSNSRTK